MKTPRDTFYFGYAMLYVWCPQALQNWVEGSLPAKERASVLRFLGLSPQWGRELAFLLHRQLPSRVQKHLMDLRERLKPPEELRTPEGLGSSGDTEPPGDSEPSGEQVEGPEEVIVKVFEGQVAGPGEVIEVFEEEEEDPGEMTEDPSLRSIREDPALYSVWEDSETPIPVYSEELGFYDFISGFYPLEGGTWSLILQKESYLRRLYPRYRLQAVAALIAAREMEIPVQEAVVVGWKGAEHLVSLCPEEEGSVHMLLGKTLEVLQGRKPTMFEVGSPQCRYCFQHSCDRYGYLQELDAMEEVSF